MADWVEIDAFYGNFRRALGMNKGPGQPATEGDCIVAKEIEKYAARARKIALRHVGGTKSEQEEVVKRLAPDAPANPPES
jgi:hypothetical protein